MFSLIALAILFAVGILIFGFECRKMYLKNTKLKNFPVFPCLPVLGNLVDLLQCDGEQIFDFPRRLMAAYNISFDEKLAFTFIGPMIFMFTDHPDTLQHVLNSEKTLTKAYLYGFLRNTNSVFTSLPTIWREHRKMLNPTLSPKMVNSFIPIFNEKNAKMINLMERQITSNVNMHQFVFNTSLDSIFRSSFGVNWSMQNKIGDDFRVLILDMLERVQMRLHTVWMKFEILYKLTDFNRLDNLAYPIVYRLVENVIETKKFDLADKLANGIDEISIAKETHSMNFLQKCLQLESEQKFNRKDVYDEMQNILLTGSESTATLVSSAILMLAIHQEYQERLIDELRSVFSDANEPVTKEHLSKLSLTELILKETLRLFPVAPYIAREASEDFPLYDGIVPKGTQIILSLFNVHRDPKYWGENALEFYPERFLPENCADHHPYQYIPFSAGPRNCMGIRYAKMSTCISLIYILRRFKFTTDLKMVDLKIRTGLTVKFINKDPLRMERREW